jgi:hypothetical protein
MADVIELKPGDPLPDHVSVLVGPAEDGSGMATRRPWTYFSYLPNVPGARESRIADAKKYAEEHGISRVYVVESGLAQGPDASVTGTVMPLKAEAETG